MIRNEIKKHLETKGSISSLEALGLYSCYDIRTAIRDLRNGCKTRKPMDIHTEMKVDQNGKKYARYSLGNSRTASAV